jgi:hypothetical protein
MSIAYLAQPEQQPTVEWLDGGTFAVLLDAAATNGQLGVGRFRVSKGEAPPYHKHLNEDEVMCTPGGFEGMFRQAGNPVTSPRQPHAEPSREAMVKAADDFGQVVLGPPR